MGEGICVDHATSKIDVIHQVSRGVSDTVRNKELYEQEAIEYGVTVKSYRGDNGLFKSQVFRNGIKRRQQFISFSGVGTHGQNVVAERAI